jgi:hypothetical protein
MTAGLDLDSVAVIADRRGTCVTAITPITTKTPSPQAHGDGRLHQCVFSPDARATWDCVDVVSGPDMSQIMPVKLACVPELMDSVDYSRQAA